MSTPETHLEDASETPVADANGDGRDTVSGADSIVTPPQAPASAAPWWKRLLGRN